MTRDRITARTHRAGLLAGVALAVFVCVPGAGPCLADPGDTSGIAAELTARTTPGVETARLAVGQLRGGTAPATVRGALVADSPLPVRDLQPDRRFVERHLIPQLNRRFEDFHDRHAVAVIGFADPDSNARRDLSALAARSAEKAASRALSDWALASTDLERRLDGWFRGRTGTTDADDDREGLRPSIGLGVSHALPRADLTWAVGDRSTLRLSIHAEGSADVEFRRESSRSERVALAWDAERDRCGLYYRLAF